MNSIFDRPHFIGNKYNNTPDIISPTNKVINLGGTITKMNTNTNDLKKKQSTPETRMDAIKEKIQHINLKKKKNTNIVFKLF
jgi:hypothetical protein